MQIQSVQDKKLVKLYIAGQEEALAELIRRYKDKIYTSIFFFVKDRYLAEDLMQETFIKVIDTLRSGKYKEQEKFLPWVMRIAHNICIDYFRKVKRSPKITNTEGFDIFNILKFSDHDIEEDIIRSQTSGKVRKLVEELPEEQRTVLILRHYSDMSFREISEMTGVSVNTALGRMRYALINIRKIMEKKNISI